MKFIKGVIILIAVFTLVIVAIGSYLSPDDIARCGAKPDVSRDGCWKAEAIVAVSGGDTEARAAEAIRLYHDGWADVLIFSGAAADKSGPSNAQVMRQQAVRAGVPRSAILIEETSETTRQNAEATASIFETQTIKSAILVTSAYHQRRALLEFERRAPSVDFRSHPVAQDKHWGPLWWATPTGWTLAVPEFVRAVVIAAGGSDL